MACRMLDFVGEDGNADDDKMEHYTMTDFIRYSISEEDTYGKCRPSNEFEGNSDTTIGHGSQAFVCKARDTKNNNEVVAIKNIHFGRGEFPQEIFREVNNLRNLRHPNIRALYDIAVSSSVNVLCLVLEYCDYTLSQYITDCPGEEISEPDQKNIGKQLFTGLSYLHNAFIIHRDLNPSNILLTSTGLIKIADLGSSRKVNPLCTPMTPGVGTIWYRAPELLLQSETYGTSADLWSAGCILAELFARKPFLPASGEIPLLKMIIQLLGVPNIGIWPGLKACKASSLLRFHETKDLFRSTLCARFPNLGKRPIELLKELIKYDPDKRLSANDCVMHEWFQCAPIPSKTLNTDFLKRTKPYVDSSKDPVPNSVID